MGTFSSNIFIPPISLNIVIKSIGIAKIRTINCKTSVNVTARIPPRPVYMRMILAEIRRLEIYEEKTSPLVDFYNKKGVLRTETVSVAINHLGKAVAAEVVADIKKGMQ